MEKFNSTLKEFLEVIKTNYSSQVFSIDNHYIFNENTKDQYLNSFFNNCRDKGDDMSSKNEIIFAKGSVLLYGIDFYHIWNDESLEDSNKDNIWKYIHTLYIYAYEYIKDQDFKSIMKEIKKLGSNRESVDEETRTFMNIIDSLTEKYTKKQPGVVDDEDEENAGDDSGDSSFKLPDLFGGVIGDLAKEIASEIDPSTLDLKDPADLLKNLLSGNFDAENDTTGISQLVKNITGKIQNKISSGSLNESQLFSEAQKVMSQFGGKKGGGGGASSNPMSMFTNIMKSSMMDHIKPEDKAMFEQAASIIGNGGSISGSSPGQLKKNIQLQSTRDRLRKKLEDKKRAQELLLKK